jgi:hypothetical protein
MNNVFNSDNKRKSRIAQLGTALPVLAVAMVLLFATANAEAGYLNLQTLGSSGSITSGGVTALFQQSSTGSGTGIFPAFVQVTGNDPIHSAYNTTENLNDGPLQNGGSDVHNHSITIGDLTTVVIGGVPYYQFFLDANEMNNAADRYISLDELRVFYGGAANQGTSDVTPPTTLGTLAYDMGAGNGVLLDYNLEPGSGRADMTFLVPHSAFVGVNNNTTVVLYSLFGSLVTTPTCGGTGVTQINPNPLLTCGVSGANYQASDGFEEWAYQLEGDEEPPVIPEPSTYALYALGASMLFLSGWWQKRRAAYDNSRV